ncbi:hypothetical protein D9M72_390450 [compost metagenome]
MFTHSITPNHTSAAVAAASGLPPIESATTGASTLTATGASIGTTMKAISKKSRKKARKKMNRFTTIRKPIQPPGSEVNRCSTQAPPSTPWNTTEKQVEPIRMNTTIAVRRAVDW